MIELEREGLLWIFGQKPTEIDLYEPVDGKDFYVYVENNKVNFKHKESFKNNIKINGVQEVATPQDTKVQLDGELGMLQSLLSKDEFIGYLKAVVILNIGKDEKYKQQILDILEEIK